MDNNDIENNLNNNTITPNPAPAEPVEPAEPPVEPVEPAPVESAPTMPVTPAPVEPVEPAEPTTPAMPVLTSEPAAGQPTQPIENPMQMQLVEPPKKDNKLTIILAAAAGVLVVLIIIILVVMNVAKPNNNSNNNGNISDNISDNTEDSEPIVNTELSAGTVEVAFGEQIVNYSAAYLVDGIEATIGSGTYESAVDNQAVFLVVNGGSLTIQGDVNIKKTGTADSEGQNDDYSFYGLNSAIVVVGAGSSATINGATITTSTPGANAVVATNGGTADVQNTTIETSSNGSRGLHATFGGTITADTVTIATQGGSSAALATDRGEGTVTVTNATLSTEGAGSPLIYSTGNITVSNSTGTANGAQIAVVEGKNSITMNDCDFSTNGIGNRNGVDNAAVMIYQSMSGDANEGTGSFTATNSTLTVLSSSDAYSMVPFFFVTNTTAEISLTDVTASFYNDGYFILASGTGEWGVAGENGAKVNISATGLDATNQNIGIDDISSVTGL